MKIVIYLFGVIITFLSFTSCSNDSEPESDPAKNKEIAEWIKRCVLDDKGEIVFVKNDATDGLYAIPVGDAENAEWFVEDLTRTEWDGKPKTVSLGVEGSVRIAGSEKEGVYNTIEFKIKGIPAFNLDIATWEYLNNDNSYGKITNVFFSKYYTCGNCKKLSSIDSSKDGKCPKCGWSDGLDGDIKVGSLLCTTEAGYAYVVTPEEAGEKDFKRCVGVVFYVGHHPEDSSENTSYSLTDILLGTSSKGKWHGYALSLHNAAKCYWMLTPIFQIGVGSTSSWNGLDNTKYMIYNKDKDYFPAAKACRYYDGEGRTAPINSSGWFLPSIAQLDYAVNHTGGTITDSFDAIYLNSERHPTYLFGNTFWSSTEWEEDPGQVAYALDDGRKAKIYKNRNFTARPILAF